ncbi:hypothetical protein DY000_02041201 [Brassica cretica]|uniref:Secreted protein n=1 Tax=Brassica cretica TaxID=69181 RepID=A0ABQ7B6B7_BRACR|nr:hypothetical protein DY000_02041201 [Brassica cretica]
MANAFVLLGDLKVSLCFSTILVRLLRFWWCGWEPRNFRRGGELMGADMFLLDAKVTVMPATLNVHRHFQATSEG